MLAIALKMLTGNRGKYFAIVVALGFTSFVMTQQPATFFGIMARTFSFLTDTGRVDLWVMDAKVQYVDDAKPMQDTKLYAVRGVEGVEWAVPMYKGSIRARLDDGTFQNCVLVGLDDVSLIGGPADMVEGHLADLRRSDSIIVDIDGASTRLARKSADGAARPLGIGDVVELNDHRATVVGLSRLSATFQSQPVIHTTYARAKAFVPAERKLLTFILVKLRPDADPAVVAERIRAATGLAAYDWNEFRYKTVLYFIRNTGILINFGLSITLAFLIGAAIAGQTFYAFTLENLRHFGVLKALGAGNGTLAKMVLVQALVAGATGYGLGVGGVAVFSHFVVGSNFRFLLLWQIPLITGLMILLVCVLTALLSIRKVIKLEPAVVFKA
ncbi:MAG: FtsX-like permease family protein [Rhodospirillales bacterium]|nr:FtsX-like permease family protein [Rhodospirillales bacterium]